MFNKISDEQIHFLLMCKPFFLLVDTNLLTCGTEIQCFLFEIWNREDAVLKTLDNNIIISIKLEKQVN